MMSGKALRRMFFGLCALVAVLALAGCGSGPTINAAQPQQAATINPGFQSQISPIPTAPPYRCGAWTSNNAPSPGATITVFARLTHNGKGVQGITAVADVHFRSGDVTLNQATSDSGGYVSFPLPLQDRQPVQVPATIDVTFSGLPGGSLKCTAFFTPR
jgi:hypothetical protein